MLPYSKKVLQHFNKPHNYGKMKNPDGVGEVGNIVCGDLMRLYIKVGKNAKKQDIIKDIKFETYGCLPPEEKILTSDGNWKSIVDFKEGDFVLNGNAKKAKVIGVSSRNYRGQMFTIVPFVSTFNKFSVTPEHPVLCIKRKWLSSSRRSSSICDWLRVKEKELLSTKPEYILAEDMSKGDYIVFPINNKVQDSPLFTEDSMKLIGYYLAEGYITANYGSLTFALNKNEKENINELKLLLQKVTKKFPKERTRRNVAEIYICSRQWVRFFDSLAGHLASKKKLAPYIVLLPFKKQWEMLQTYIKGDGNLYRRREKDSPICRAASVSKELIIQLQQILARGGIFSSIKEYKNKNPFSCIEGRKVAIKDVYGFSFKNDRKHKFVHVKENYFLVPIRNIEKKYYSGKVYNIQVEGKYNSYLVRGFAVHNCLAAIASSSMLTDLVKGKTIEQAIDFNRKEIVEELNGLPPIKLHCSVLAGDALLEAIHDYLTKNKKPIPQKLKLKHQQLQKEKERFKK